MAVDEKSQEVDGEPDQKPPVDAPVQAASNENIPSKPTDNASAQNDSIAIKLEQDIKAGERWLIGIGIATLLMNSVIALIYWGQLREMRNSNQATQEALKITRDQFNLQNRAYLELVDANGKGGGYGMAKVVLKNYGHTTARNLTLHLSLDRLRVDPPTLKVRIVEKIPFTMTVKSVPPGDVPTYIGGVYAPTYRDAAKVGHTDALRIIGDGFYDTGFGQEDTIVICLAFQGGRNQWEPCAGNESVTVKRSPH